MTRRDDYHQFFGQQTAVFGRDGQRSVREATVAVIGTGGIGSAAALALAAAGVGHLVVIDPQAFTADNLNRLAFATRRHLGRPKVSVLRSGGPHRRRRAR